VAFRKYTDVDFGADIVTTVEKSKGISRFVSKNWNSSGLSMSNASLGPATVTWKSNDKSEEREKKVDPSNNVIEVVEKEQNNIGPYVRVKLQDSSGLKIAVESDMEVAVVSGLVLSCKLPDGYVLPICRITCSAGRKPGNPPVPPK
jgi:hypothetical protein